MKARIRQTTFKQFNWGGKRRGAGRKRKGVRPGVSHAKRPEIDPRCPLHVTLRLLPGITTLRSWNELDLLHRLVKDLNAGVLVQVASARRRGNAPTRTASRPDAPAAAR